MKFLLSFLLLFPVAQLWAQDLSHDQALADLQQLKQAILDYQPTLDAYQPGFEEAATDLLARLPEDSISYIQFFQFASKLASLGQEGHYAMGTWQDTVHSGFLNDEFRYLPISVKIIDGRLFVAIDNSVEQSLKKGAEIIRINGREPVEVLKKLYATLPSDGTITTYQDRKIEEGFSWMYYLFVDQREEHDFTVRDLEGNQQEIRIRALTRTAQLANYQRLNSARTDGASDESSGFYQLEFKGASAVLALPSFDRRRVEKHGVTPKKLYKGLFQDFHDRDIQQLVIDLRGNTGGLNEFADGIVPFIQQAGASAPFLKRTISWAGKERTYKFPKPSKWAFQGAIYVLVDGQTYSAGSTLARYLKEFGRATVIGEETGTRYEGFAAGSKQYIRLNHSQIRIGVPRYHILFPSSSLQTTQNHGLMPDLKVGVTVDTWLAGRDVVMEQVMEMMAGQVQDR
ncbi:S41 family peptidase [Pontibacter sp. G13]|uniref:S41 family peptidase n=1 Tax=Pontibacter sp. G13 TaxID=3074898 RepID=UPI00288A3628|nr:S41 family peptidase [Pontibacter sp. G13]WNJ19029.1 S41 family peptidase [Pontibacter sp. G13]